MIKCCKVQLELSLSLSLSSVGFSWGPKALPGTPLCHLVEVFMQSALLEPRGFKSEAGACLCVSARQDTSW